jgi:general secretion pathway protein A
MNFSFFGLREAPFSLTPDPRFLHLAEPHRAALANLLQGVVCRKGFMVVTGPVGTGKTTLMHACLRILTEKFFAEKPILSAFLVNPTLTREEFLESLLVDFEVDCPSTSKPRRLVALLQAFLEAQRRGGTSVLVIDEAHLLSLELLEEIRLLSNMDTYREKLLQVILCGQSELSTMLAKPELRALQQRIASRGQLRALSLPETRAYLAERLHAAGLQGSSPFLGPSVTEIYNYTGGVPRLVNLICEASLWIGWNTQTRQLEPYIIQEAAASVGLVEAIEPDRVETSLASSPQVENPVKPSVDILIKAMRQRP